MDDTTWVRVAPAIGKRARFLKLPYRESEGQRWRGFFEVPSWVVWFVEYYVERRWGSDMRNTLPPYTCIDWDRTLERAREDPMFGPALGCVGEANDRDAILLMLPVKQNPRDQALYAQWASDAASDRAEYERWAPDGDPDDEDPFDR